MTRLILIRHGETDYNLKKKYCGSRDISLNKTGRAQARNIKTKLKGSKIDKVFCSDLKRSWQTAKIIFADTGLSIVKKRGLREISFGKWEGLTYKQVLKKFPFLYKKWLKNPFSVAIPKGEKLNFKKRIVKAFKKIIALNKNRTVAVVSHGGAISIFINHLLKSKDFWKQIPHPASLSIVEYKNGKAKIRLFNDTSHLIPPTAGCR